LRWPAPSGRASGGTGVAWPSGASPTLAPFVAASSSAPAPARSAACPTTATRPPLRSSATACRRNSRIACTPASDARRLRRIPNRPSALLDPTRSEEGEESHRENAEQEGEIHPRGRCAPIHVPRIPGDRDEFEEGERGVSSGQGPDPRDIVL